MPNFKYLNQPQIGHLASDPLLQSCGCWILRGIITRKSLRCDCDTGPGADMGHQWHGQCGGGGNESWGRSSGELTNQWGASWGWETHCHVFALTMPHYDWECHYRADTMSPPGSAAHKHSHLWQWAKQFISQNFTESMQSANDCVLKAFVTV